VSHPMDALRFFFFVSLSLSLSPSHPAAPFFFLYYCRCLLLFSDAVSICFALGGGVSGTDAQRRVAATFASIAATVATLFFGQYRRHVAEGWGTG